MKLKINLTILLLVLSFVITTNNVFAETVSTESSVETKDPAMKIDAKVKLNSTIEKNIDRRRGIKNNQKEEIKNLHASTSIMIRNIGIEKKKKMDDIRNSSTTMSRGEIKAEEKNIFKIYQGEKREIKKTSRANEFKIRKDALVKLLNISLENLADIRTRINNILTKMDSTGKSTVEARASLVIADNKLIKAKIAVDALANYTAPISNGAAVGSIKAEIELLKPRQIGYAAIKAVKEARDSLKDVVRLIITKHREDRGTASSTPTN